MFPKLFSILVLLCVIQNAVSDFTIQLKEELLDVTNFNSSYYDPSNEVALKGELEEYIRNPFNARISFRGLSCNCQDLNCNCCAGIDLPKINFHRVTCTKFFVDKDELSFHLSFNVNGNRIFYTSVSLNNPPPLCFPFPSLRFLRFCIQFYDVYVVDKNLHACFDLETRLGNSPVLILHFNCVQLGAEGINWMKPQNLNQITNQTQQQVEEPVVYDDVDFEQVDLEDHPNHTTTLTPEEEAQIGQLKL
ncbi:hypothetical protein ANTQUA_LOCUS4090 [Anthophora quadrimaculata]